MCIVDLCLSRWLATANFYWIRHWSSKEVRQGRCPCPRCDSPRCVGDTLGNGGGEGEGGHKDTPTGLMETSLKLESGNRDLRWTKAKWSVTSHWEVCCGGQGSTRSGRTLRKTQWGVIRSIINWEVNLSLVQTGESQLGWGKAGIFLFLLDNPGWRHKNTS